MRATFRFPLQEPGTRTYISHVQHRKLIRHNFLVNLYQQLKLMLEELSYVAVLVKKTRIDRQYISMKRTQSDKGRWDIFQQ